MCVLVLNIFARGDGVARQDTDTSRLGCIRFFCAFVPWFKVRALFRGCAVMACDAKLNFDDNAEWRQKDTFQFRDYTQEDTREVGITIKENHLVCAKQDAHVFYAPSTFVSTIQFSTIQYTAEVPVVPVCAQTIHRYHTRPALFNVLSKTWQFRMCPPKTPALVRDLYCNGFDIVDEVFAYE